MNKIGIGITSTSNRAEMARNTLTMMREYLPKDAKLVIVTDTEGIAKAKNQCLALLDEAVHIFLFDDDTHPIAHNWWMPYVFSGMKHLCFTFSHLANGGKNGNRELIKEVDGIKYYQNPSGCMLYLHRDCLDAVGGFDERYDVYSYEHVTLSLRIHNAGLTPYPFMDVANSLELFYSHDYHGTCKSSLPADRRGLSIRNNRPLYNATVENKSKEYIAYK